MGFCLLEFCLLKVLFTPGSVYQKPVDLNGMGADCDNLFISLFVTLMFTRCQFHCLQSVQCKEGPRI